MTCSIVGSSCSSTRPSPSQVSHEAKNTGTNRGRGSIVCSTVAVDDASVCGWTCAVLRGTSITSPAPSARDVPPTEPVAAPSSTRKRSMPLS
jgi:hypothetical protein